MSKDTRDIYFVLTEEGMEGSGKHTAQEALIEYIELENNDDQWIDDLLDGGTEINGIVKMTREEYKEWLKTKGTQTLTSKFSQR